MKYLKVQVIFHFDRTLRVQFVQSDELFGTANAQKDNFNNCD